jgi:hypothetical protein
MKHQHYRLPVLICAALISNAAMGEDAVKSEEKISGAESRRAAALTIYNNNLALIREERAISVQQGQNIYALRDVAATIKPETALFKSLSSNTFHLLEQNYNFDLLTPDALLKKYVGQSVTVISKNPTTDKETRETAKVLSAQNGVVFRFADRIETNLPPNARLAFHDIPTTLRDRPTLTVNFESAKTAQERVELSYLANGFSWRADYVASLSSDEKTLDLSGWVTLANLSGTDFPDAKLQLVAGDVHRVIARKATIQYEARNLDYPSPAVPAPMQEEALFEYHLYTLPFLTTLYNNQTKQVALLSTAKIPTQKEYRLENGNLWFYRNNDSLPEAGQPRKVEVFITFDNKKPLGEPLPKGIVRVYQNDQSGKPNFVGEDEIDHTPKNETVRLRLGNAFDVTGLWKRVNYRKLSKTVTEQSFEIELKNAKTIPVQVKIVEPIYGEWEITKESAKHQKADANNALWLITVPPQDKVTLSYTVKSR